MRPKTKKLVEVVRRLHAIGREFVGLIRADLPDRRAALRDLLARVEATGAEMVEAMAEALAAWGSGEERPPSERLRLGLLSIAQQGEAQVAEGREWAAGRRARAEAELKRLVEGDQ